MSFERHLQTLLDRQDTDLDDDGAFDDHDYDRHNDQECGL